MTADTFRRLALSCAIAGAGLSGCATQPEAPRTLADLDRPLEQAPSGRTPGAAATAEQARAAYYRFIETAGEDERARNLALARLADLELAESYALSAQDDYRDDPRYRSTLRRTIELLETALADYPDARGNDRKLYQLAKSYDELGEHEPSQRALQQLVDAHPQSDHYAEAQFRLAETAFAEGSFMAAELGYSSAIYHNPDPQFQERALFKRGWSRYRQGVMDLAIADFVAVISTRDFADPAEVAADQRALYNEYFRSLALSMINHPQPAQVPAQLTSAGLADILPAYLAASNLLEQQARISDAVALWQYYGQSSTDAWVPVQALTRQVTLWRSGRFHQRAITTTDDLYQAYAAAVRASDPSDDTLTQATRTAFKQAAQHYHASYQDGASESDLAAARRWYQRYLSHFDGYALQDGIALAYADLLAETDDLQGAFAHYQRAGFDGSLIINPEAAYAAIALLRELIDEGQETQWAQYLTYTEQFVQVYPDDERTQDLLTAAADTAYAHSDYPRAIQFIEQALPGLRGSARFDAQRLLVQSHIHQQQWQEAEQAAYPLLSRDGLSTTQQEQAQELWAYSVYQQAEAAEAAGDWAQAIADYQRIDTRAHTSDYAGNGLYNAIALSVEQAQWLEAIALMQHFQARYPEHRHRSDVERHLTQAYLATGQTAEAARQFEQLAQSEEDEQTQRAALWQAAELYEAREDHEQAINAYRRYAHSYPDPYPQNAEAMHRLAELYRAAGNTENRQFWERRLIQAERSRADDDKNPRTALLAARAALSLGQHYLERFEDTPLRLPLEQSLARKTAHMQDAIRHFATSASFGFAELASEATHNIGYIYETLARDMLASDRPPELNPEELVQYEILLEDRAFPFEDRAIEFYERNLQRADSEGFNPWMGKSRARLAALFPARYARPPRVGLILSYRDNSAQESGEQTQ